MKIEGAKFQDIRAEVVKWAQDNGFTVTNSINHGEGDRLHRIEIHLMKDGTGLEFTSSADFGYIHGEGSLNTLSTTIMDTDELGEAVERLLKVHGPEVNES